MFKIIFFVDKQIAYFILSLNVFMSKNNYKCNNNKR